jgi:hypothetical protein
MGVNQMITVGLLIKGFLDLMQTKLNNTFEMPIELTDGCLIMGNGDMGKDGINKNALYFNYRQKPINVKSVFGNIIENLNRIEDYEEEIIVTGTSADHSLDPFNTIPYGLPSKCHGKLVVIVDGKKDIGFIINKALLHVGMACKGVTTNILFYITIDKSKWYDIWSLYEPAFNKLQAEKHILCFEYFK